MGQLADLTQAVRDTHEATKNARQIYLAMPLDDPGKADAYLALCEAARTEIKAGETLEAEKQRILAKA